jgi:hypothetical protein
MYVIKYKQNILFLNNLFGKTYWRFGDHVLLNTCWQFGVLLSLSAYVYDPTYIGPQYNKNTYMVVIMYRYILAGILAFFYR